MSDQSLRPSSPTSTGRLRSGTAARLAGLPATTLRVWERRYGVVAAPKASNGQRLYSDIDVLRLGVLRQLTGRGHAISTIAGLDLVSLQALANAPSGVAGTHALASPTVVVVGHGIAQKLRSVGSCKLEAIHEDLAQAEAHAAPAEGIDLLVVHLPSLQPGVPARVLALAARLEAGAIVVLYAFGADAVAEPLRAAGATVRRGPISGRELARLIATLPTSSAPAPASATLQTAPRRYSDDALATIAELPSSIACECMRHVAELAMQLAGFERYSGDCVSRGPADAALHRHLSEVAGASRTMFEKALERMLAEEAVAPARYLEPPTTDRSEPRRDGVKN